MTAQRTIAVIAACALLAVSCGGDDSGDDAAATDSSTDTTGQGEPGATDGAPATDETAGDSTGASAEPSEPPCDAPVPGSELTYGVYGPATGIDPTLSSGALVGGAELAAVYDVLFRFDYETNEYIPHLAESITPNDDYTVWTLKLRKGIEYADGTPLTAQLVDENIDRFFREGVRNGSAGFMTPIEKRDIVDDLTLRLTLESPWVEFPYVFSDEPGMIVNANAIGDDADQFAIKPPPSAGLGPYVVERNAPNEELVLKARDDYWGGPVCIERLRFVFIPGAPATYDAFTSGELDVAFIRDPQVIDQIREAGDDAFWIQQDSGTTFMINHAKGRPGNDLRVRQAIWLALDENALSERVFQGMLKTGKSLFQEGSRFYSDAIETMDTDPEQAKQLLDEAKADGYDGELELLCPTSPPSPDVALTAEGLLEAIGFDVTTKILPITEQIARVSIEWDYDATCWGLGIGPETGITAVMRGMRGGSEGNRQSYANPDMDAAIDAAMAAETPEDLQAAMADVNNIFVDDAVSASYGAVEEGIVWQPNVHGIIPTTSSIMLFHDAYIDDAG